MTIKDTISIAELMRLNIKQREQYELEYATLLDDPETPQAKIDRVVNKLNELKSEYDDLVPRLEAEKIRKDTFKAAKYQTKAAHKTLCINAHTQKRIEVLLFLCGVTAAVCGMYKYNLTETIKS